VPAPPSRPAEAAHNAQGHSSNHRAHIGTYVVVTLYARNAGYVGGASGSQAGVLRASRVSRIAPDRAICAGFSAAIAAGSRCAFKAALSDSVCGSDEGWDAHPGHLVCQGR
jgi:hypothetical protein